VTASDAAVIAALNDRRSARSRRRITVEFLVECAADLAELAYTCELSARRRRAIEMLRA
jgi:hypothetical protein